MTLVALMAMTTGAWAQTNTEVTPVPEQTNQWQFTMPAGKVELSIVYKAVSEMAVTFDETAIPEEGLTVYMGNEAGFTTLLASAVTGVENPEFTYESDNTEVIVFQDGENEPTASGALENIKFLKAGTANLTVKFNGNDDYSKAEVKFLVTVSDKLYTVTVNDGDVDTNNWTLTPAEATTPGVKPDTEVKATYGGTLKVKSVKAVVKGEASDAVTLATAFTNGAVVKVVAYYDGGTTHSDGSIEGTYNGTGFNNVTRTNPYTNSAMSNTDGKLVVVFTRNIYTKTFTFDPANNSYTQSGSDRITLTSISVNGTDIKEQLTAAQ